MQACLDEEIEGLGEVGFMDNRVILDLFFSGAGIFPLLKEQTEFDQGGSACFEGEARGGRADSCHAELTAWVPRLGPSLNEQAQGGAGGQRAL